MIRVRNLREGERMPEGFSTGYEHMPVMRDWVWLAEIPGRLKHLDAELPLPLDDREKRERSSEVFGVLLAAPCHGLVYFMRLCMKEGANPATAAILIRGCMKACEKRGFKGYFFHVSGQSEVERSLIPIVRKAGGVQIPQPQMMLVGPIDEAVKR